MDSFLWLPGHFCNFTTGILLLEGRCLYFLHKQPRRYFLLKPIERVVSRDGKLRSILFVVNPLFHLPYSWITCYSPFKIPFLIVVCCVSCWWRRRAPSSYFSLSSSDCPTFTPSFIRSWITSHCLFKIPFLILACCVRCWSAPSSYIISICQVRTAQPPLHPFLHNLMNHESLSL